MVKGHYLINEVRPKKVLSLALRLPSAIIEYWQCIGVGIETVSYGNLIFNAEDKRLLGLRNCAPNQFSKNSIVAADVVRQCKNSHC
jgi:hypothetical protein